MRKAVVLLSITLITLGVWFVLFPGGNSRARAEREHGIKLPASSQHIQCRGDAWVACAPDRGAATMFELSTNDVAAFTSQLQIRSRSRPVVSKGDPIRNGYNVWPEGSGTFVPGNSQYGGFKRTWHGEATPIEMLSCGSRKGDWLHVELWQLSEGGMVVKMYTDWN